MLIIHSNVSRVLFDHSQFKAFIHFYSVFSFPFRHHQRDTLEHQRDISESSCTISPLGKKIKDNLVAFVFMSGSRVSDPTAFLPELCLLSEQGGSFRARWRYWSQILACSVSDQWKKNSHQNLSNSITKMQMNRKKLFSIPTKQNVKLLNKKPCLKWQVQRLKNIFLQTKK